MSVLEKFLLFLGLVSFSLAISLNHAFQRIQTLQYVQDLLQLTIHTTNRVLMDKGFITEEDVENAQEEVLQRTDFVDYIEMKKNIETLGFDITPDAWKKSDDD